MLNFGLWDLRVVAPQCDYHSEMARALASGANSVLEHARAFNTTEEAVADLQLVFASTARSREGFNHPIYSPREIAQLTLPTSGSVPKSGILFGSERNGLVNGDIALATAIAHIPTIPAFSSLNLAQAVNVFAYEIYQRRMPHLKDTARHRERATIETDNEASERVTHGELEALVQRVFAFMNLLHYPRRPAARTRSLMQVRHALHRHALSVGEVRWLHGLVRTMMLESFNRLGKPMLESPPPRLLP